MKTLNAYAKHIWPKVCWKSSVPQAWLIRNAQCRPHPFFSFNHWTQACWACVCVCLCVCSSVCRCMSVNVNALLRLPEFICTLSHHTTPFFKLLFFMLQYHFISPAPHFLKPFSLPVALTERGHFHSMNSEEYYKSYMWSGSQKKSLHANSIVAQTHLVCVFWPFVLLMVLFFACMVEIKTFLKFFL